MASNASPLDIDIDIDNEIQFALDNLPAALAAACQPIEVDGHFVVSAEADDTDDFDPIFDLALLPFTKPG